MCECVVVACLSVCDGDTHLCYDVHINQMHYTGD